MAKGTDESAIMAAKSFGRAGGGEALRGRREGREGDRERGPIHAKVEMPYLLPNHISTT